MMTVNDFDFTDDDGELPTLDGYPRPKVCWKIQYDFDGRGWVDLPITFISREEAEKTINHIMTSWYDPNTDTIEMRAVAEVQAP